MGKGKEITIGYKYYLGVHFVLCHGPVDALYQITVDDRTAWAGTSTGGVVTVNSPKLFGGEKKEGGIAGTLDFMTGSWTQPQNSYLNRKLGTTITAAYVPPTDGTSIAYLGLTTVTTTVTGGVKTVVTIDEGGVNTTEVTSLTGEITTTVTTPLPGGGTDVDVTVTPAPVEDIESTVPAYRGVASVVLNQMYMGTNPYLKKWAFMVQRINTKSDGSAQWYLAKAAIGLDMNPAHIIRECLTDTHWGMGYLSSDIDETTFIAAADALYTEGFGLSILWQKESTIEDFIKDVLRHIDAALYVDKATGKFMLRLIRADYTISTLPALDEDTIVRIEDYACSTFTELVNSVTVNFWDRTATKNSSLTVDDIALVQLQGAVVARTQEYGGITSGTLAAKVAARDLRALSTPIVRCTVYANRNAASLVPGQAVKLTWPDYGIDQLVMRIGAIEFGTATDNTIKLALLQDVFSLGAATYAAPAQTAWVPVINDPQPAANRTTIEAPYYTLVKAYGESDINSKIASLPAVGHVLTAAARPTRDSIGANVYVDAGAGYKEEVALDFSPYGVCSAVVTPMATTIPLSTSSDFYVDTLAAGDYALLGPEIVKINSYSASSVSVSRGCLDTVPAQHAAGTKLFAISRMRGLGSTEHLLSETINVKICPATGKGELAIGSAPSSSLTFAQRAYKAYPPGQWKVCDVYFPNRITDLPLTTTWAHRNRLQQTSDTIYDFTYGNIGPEAGTTYSLRLYNNDTSALLHTVDGVTGTSYSGFPALTGTLNLRMELWSVRDILPSLQKHSHVFYYENIARLTLEDSSGRFTTEDDILIVTE